MLLEAMCLAIAMWGEARGEPVTGMVAVAEVVLNRTNDRRWPDNVCDVVFEPHQFSGVTDRMVEKGRWTKLVPLAEGVLSARGTAKSAKGVHFDATNFYAPKLLTKPPKWARCMDVTAEIGGHIFLTDTGRGCLPEKHPDAPGTEVFPDPYEGGSYASFEEAATPTGSPAYNPGPVLHGPAEVG